MPEEERSHGTISTKIYIRYLITGGGYVFTFIVFCLFIVTEVCYKKKHDLCVSLNLNFLPT